MPLKIYFRKGKFSHTRDEPKDKPPTSESSTYGNPIARQATQKSSRSFVEQLVAAYTYKPNSSIHDGKGSPRISQPEDEYGKLESLTRVPTHREQFAYRRKSPATVALSTEVACGHRPPIDLINRQLQHILDEDSLARQGRDGDTELDELEPLIRVHTNRQQLAAPSKAPATMSSSRKTATANESPTESISDGRGIVPHRASATVQFSNEIAIVSESPTNMKTWREQRLLARATKAVELKRQLSSQYLPHTSSSLSLPPANSADLSLSPEKAGFPSETYKKATAQLRKVHQRKDISNMRGKEMDDVTDEKPSGEKSSASTYKSHSTQQLSTFQPVAEISSPSKSRLKRRHPIKVSSDSTGVGELPLNVNSVDRRGNIRFEGPYNRRPAFSQPHPLLPKAPLPVFLRVHLTASGPDPPTAAIEPEVAESQETPSNFHAEESYPAATAANGVPYPHRVLPVPGLLPPYMRDPNALNYSSHYREPTVLREPVDNNEVGHQAGPIIEYVERSHPRLLQLLNLDTIDIYGVSPENDVRGSRIPTQRHIIVSEQSEGGARRASEALGQAVGAWQSDSFSPASVSVEYGELLPSCPPNRFSEQELLARQWAGDRASQTSARWPSVPPSVVSADGEDDEQLPPCPRGLVCDWVNEVPVAPSFVSTWTASEEGSDVDVVMPDAIHRPVAPWDEEWPPLASVAGCRTPDEVVVEPIIDVIGSEMGATQDRGLLGGAGPNTATTSTIFQFQSPMSIPIPIARSGTTTTHRHEPLTDADYARRRRAGQARRRENAADNIKSGSPASDELFVSAVRLSQDSTSSQAATSSQSATSSLDPSSSQVFGPSRVISPSEAITTPYPRSFAPSPQPWDPRWGTRPRNTAARTAASGKCETM